MIRVARFGNNPTGTDVHTGKRSLFFDDNRPAREGSASRGIFPAASSRVSNKVPTSDGIERMIRVARFGNNPTGTDVHAGKRSLFFDDNRPARDGLAGLRVSPHLSFRALTKAAHYKHRQQRGRKPLEP